MIENTAPALPAPDRASRRQRQAAQAFDRQRGHHDIAARKAVDGVAGDEREAGEGHELHQPDEAQIECAVGQRIDVPADRHRLHLPRRRAEKRTVRKRRTSQGGGSRSPGLSPSSGIGSRRVSRYFSALA